MGSQTVRIEELVTGRHSSPLPEVKITIPSTFSKKKFFVKNLKIFFLDISLIDRIYFLYLHNLKQK